MRVVGYGDRWSVVGGDAVRVMVSCEAESFEAEVVRLFHGDLNPAGPGFKAEVVESAVVGRYPGRRQELRPGSYVEVGLGDLVCELDGVSVAVWVYATALGPGSQGLVSWWDEESGAGFELSLSRDGELDWRFGDGAQRLKVASGLAVLPRVWTFVAASTSPAEGVARLAVRAVQRWANDEVMLIERPLSLERVAVPAADFVLAGRQGSGQTVCGHFNGKLDSPMVMARGASADELSALAQDQLSSALQGSLLARWDFSREIGSDRVVDVSGNGRHGRTVNLPTRAVTGRGWNGRQTWFEAAPSEYSAIHFHDDDLEDARWEPNFELEIPADWESGVYAVRLSSGDAEDYVPFFVRPPTGKPTAPIALLIPTYTYLAYANDHWHSRPGALASSGLTAQEFGSRGRRHERMAFAYICDERLNSIYDLHTDESSVRYASRLRPTPNIRPSFNKPSSGFRLPDNLTSDLYIVDWLRERGYAVDVLTDEDLHAEGVALLEPYRVVLTGSHPEYWTERMLDSLESYIGAGGRVMYLGGNGFYWVTTVHPDKPHVIEVRKRDGAGAIGWLQPGEDHHSTTGEPGGLWMMRNRSAHSLVGIGTAAIGFASAAPYRRTQLSYSQEFAFMFVEIDEPILGDFGLHLGGAAGWEIDSAVPELGSPSCAHVIATSITHDESYSMVPELTRYRSDKLGTTASRSEIRSDIVYLANARGGQVFSVGSISFGCALSHNNYENNISRLTENVLLHFLENTNGGTRN